MSLPVKPVVAKPVVKPAITVAPAKAIEKAALVKTNPAGPSRAAIAAEVKTKTHLLTDLAKLKTYTTCFLVGALYQNPHAQSFPWEGGFTRAQVLKEVDSRSEKHVVFQLTSNLPEVGTRTGDKTVAASVNELK